MTGSCTDMENAAHTDTWHNFSIVTGDAQTKTMRGFCLSQSAGMGYCRGIARVCRGKAILGYLPALAWSITEQHTTLQ